VSPSLGKHLGKHLKEPRPAASAEKLSSSDGIEWLAKL
jgi:hypothetical protein